MTTATNPSSTNPSSGNPPPAAATAAHPEGVAADPDPRPLFARAVSVAGATIAAVDPADLDAPTPCSEFRVRDLLDHLVMVLRRVAAMGRGESPFAVDATVADQSWTAAWSSAAQEVERVWSDPAVLRRTVILPWTTKTGAETLALYLNEVIVHTWDLAAATDQHPTWDDGALAVALAAMESELPAEGRTELLEASVEGLPTGDRAALPFAAAVPVATGAPLIDRLVAWSGRRPPSAA